MFKNLKRKIIKRRYYSKLKYIEDRLFKEVKENNLLIIDLTPNQDDNRQFSICVPNNPSVNLLILSYIDYDMNCIILEAKYATCLGKNAAETLKANGPEDKCFPLYNINTKNGDRYFKINVECFINKANQLRDLLLIL